MGFLLHHSVRKGADLAPDHAAFVCGDDQLTYGELSRRVFQTARLLQDLGVRPGDRVGLYLPKAIELPIALYAVLEAGAAYVPIDPGAPLQRVAQVVSDAGIEVLISSAQRTRQCRQLLAGQAAGSMPLLPGLRHIVGIEPDDAAPSGSPHCTPLSAADALPSTPLDVRRVAGDLAYIMFTSGSTGAPKGLMHTHSSGLAYAQLSAREYGVQPKDRLGNHSPLHFDMSTFEYLTGPFARATTVMIPDDVLLFPQSVAELIERERLTFWYSVPLALIQLMERGGIEQRDCSALRWVLFGGEPFSPRHLSRLMRLWPQARFSNSYGPAEVNQCTAYHLPQGQALDPQRPVPLGEIWPGAEGIILGDDDQPVVEGEQGELVIRSATRMRGYWRRPDLNERAFTVRNLAGGMQGTFYRTGDLVYRGADDLLHFVGRRDRQVKLRGYRVELDEIESVACELSFVSEAAAIVVHAAPQQTGAQTQEKLLALAVLRDSSDTSEPPAELVAMKDTLERHLTDRLPHYAVPAPDQIKLVDTLPRTGSGKVDRRQLGKEWHSGVTQKER